MVLQDAMKTKADDRNGVCSNQAKAAVETAVSEKEVSLGQMVIVQEELDRREDVNSAPLTCASERLKAFGSGKETFDLLSSLNIQCHQMKWQDMYQNVPDTSAERFDLLLTDPPYGVLENPAKAGTRYNDFDSV